jgi:hypothetical protein
LLMLDCCCPILVGGVSSCIELGFMAPGRVCLTMIFTK